MADEFKREKERSFFFINYDDVTHFIPFMVFLSKPQIPIFFFMDSYLLIYLFLLEILTNLMEILISSHNNFFLNLLFFS